MNEKGGPVIMVFLLFGLFWLCSEPAKKIEPIPVDQLIEQVAVVKESLTSELLNNSEQSDYIPDATKIIEHEKLRREIIIFTRPNCPPCDQWKRCEQAKFEADGWVVAYCSEHNFSLTPTFVIERNGRTTEHRGYLPFAKIDEVTR